MSGTHQKPNCLIEITPITHSVRQDSEDIYQCVGISSLLWQSNRNELNAYNFSLNENLGVDTPSMMLHMSEFNRAHGSQSHIGREVIVQEVQGGS